MSNEIPPLSRELVTARERGLCSRCSGPGSDWHHRRRRRVRGEHQHCPCNGLLLCRACHSWAHAHPVAAREEGVILPTTVAEPFEVRVKTWQGWVTVTCDGHSEWLGRARDFPALKW